MPIEIQAKIMKMLEPVDSDPYQYLREHEPPPGFGIDPALWQEAIDIAEKASEGAVLVGEEDIMVAIDGVRFFRGLPMKGHEGGSPRGRS